MRRSRSVTATARRVLFAVTVLLLVLPVAGALGKDRAQQLLRDACRDGKVDGTYSQADFRRALIELPADTDQYTNCRDVLNEARLAALSSGRDKPGGGSGGGTGAGGGGTSGGGTSGGGVSGGGGTTTPGGAPTTGATGAGGSSGGAVDSLAGGTQADPLATTTPAERESVTNATAAGGKPIRVGRDVLTPGAVKGLSHAANHLPTPLIVLLAALAACALAAGGHTAYGRVLARRAR
jgi:hypothetical protein